MQNACPGETVKAAFSLTTMVIEEENHQLNICPIVCQKLTDIFFWPLDKFLYLILLSYGIVTLGGVNEREKPETFNKVVWARPDKGENPDYF